MRQDKMLRRLDDGCVVFQLHGRADPVILVLHKYNVVNRLASRRFWSGFTLGLIIFGWLLLYIQGLVPTGAAILIGAILAVFAQFLEVFFMRRLKAIIETAPVSTEDKPEHRPSRIELAFQSVDDRTIRSGIILFGMLFLASCYVLIAKALGIVVPAEMNSIVIALGLPLFGVILWACLKERRRRSGKVKKQI